MSSFSLARKLTLEFVQKQEIEKRSDQGLTLVEGLIAMVLISITMVSITPPIFWAVASRVQTQRAEQGQKLAQGEIDRVRTLVERGGSESTITNFPPTAANLSEAAIRSSTSPNFPAAPNTPNTPLSSLPMISTADSCAKATFPPSTVLAFTAIDTDGDCKPDFLLQTFRSQGLDQNGNAFTNAAGQTLSGFVMGVRVYSIVARDTLINSQGRTQPAALRGTNGVGNQLNRPLAVLYSTIVSSNASQNLDLYRKLCPAANGAC